MEQQCRERTPHSSPVVPRPLESKITPEAYTVITLQVRLTADTATTPSDSISDSTAQDSSGNTA